MGRWLGAGVALLAAGAWAASPAMTFDVLSKSRKCERKKYGDEATVCTYRSAPGFLLELDGVGTENVVVSVLEASMESGLFASFDSRSTCVTIRSGSKGPMGTVYVSTRDGRVYRNLQDCQSQKGE